MIDISDGLVLDLWRILEASGCGAVLDETALDAAVRRTRSFARRQRVWFRRDPRITWLGSPENSCAVLPALLAWWCP
jgi:tRNA dimethylallyltransferase